MSGDQTIARIASENLSRVDCPLCHGRLHAGHRADCPVRRDQQAHIEHMARLYADLQRGDET